MIEHLAGKSITDQLEMALQEDKQLWRKTGRRLLVAVEESRLTEVESLLNMYPELVHFQAEEDGWTALHVAAHSGTIDLCEMLLQRGSRVDVKTMYGETVLHAAA